MAAFQIIRSGHADGETNMRFDAEMFGNFDPSDPRPVFRVYGWDPPAVSIGRFQRPEDFLDLEACERRGIPVVRRITGGGAIFHAREVTYSFVCPASILPAGLSVAESFKRLTSFLISAYTSLGLDARYAVDAASDASSLPASELGKPTAVCYAGQERYDILVGGKKLGGNAQRRTRDVIFQHGSIPLEDASDLFEGCLLNRKSILRQTTLKGTGQDDAGGVRDYASIFYGGNATNLAELEIETGYEELAENLIARWNESAKQF